MKKTVIFSATIAIIGLSWFAFAKGYKVLSGHKEKNPDEVSVRLADADQTNADFNDEEKSIIKELQDLFQDLSSKSSFYFSGSIEMHDPVDSAEMNTFSQFSFLKRDDLIYYKNNDQECINTNEYYAVADHVAKKIVVSAAKQIQEINPVSLPALSKNFKSDGYSIEKKEEGNKTIIKLLCKNHITCKEIKVEFDRSTRKPFLLFYRFTDFDHPEDNLYDKTITVKIADWEIGAADHEHSVPQLISVDNELITAAKEFEAYEIMNLLNN